MKEIRLRSEKIDEQRLAAELENWLASRTTPPKKVLLLPPDVTRFHSKAGLIVQLLYKALAPKAQVDILPALGTHVAMSEEE